MRTTDGESLVALDQPTGSAGVPMPVVPPNGNGMSVGTAGSMHLAHGGSARVPVPHTSLVEIVHRRWQRVVSVLGACVFLALVYCLFAHRMYTGTASLYVAQVGPRLVTDGAEVVGRPDTYLYTQIALIKSTPLVKAAVENGKFNEMKSFDGVGNIVDAVKGSLEVDLGRKDDIITIAYDASTPQESKAIVDSVVKSYMDYQTAQRQNTAQEVVKFLEKEKEKQSGLLADKEKALVEFRGLNGSLSLSESDKGNIIIQRLSQISSALTESELDSINQKANWDAAKIMLADPVQRQSWLDTQHANTRAVFNDDTAVRQLSAWQLRLAALRHQYSDNHPAVLNALAYIDQLKKKLGEADDQLISGYLASQQQAYENTLHRAKDLQVAFDNQQKTAFVLNSKAAEQARLESEVRQSTRLCESLDERIKEMSVMSDSTSLNTTIVEPPDAGLSPSKPMKARILAAALAIGLLLGFGYAWVGERTEHRFHTPEEVQSTLGLPVFAVIPHMNGAQPARGRYVQLESMSVVAEAYRSLRTAIYFGIPTEKSKTLLITSPAAGDGKSTTASNLAIAMAQAGRRVLVVDTDFRKPAQHKIFDVDDSVGLSSVLAGTSSLENAIRRVNVDRVDVLPCGPLPANPSEILNSEMFGELLAQLAGKYDHVILDSPPVTAVTDARILSAMCDGTMLVLRAGKSTRRSSENACDALLSVGARVHGVVVNDVSTRAVREGYYYGYGYRNGNAAAQINGEGERIRVRIHSRKAEIAEAGLLE